MLNNRTVAVVVSAYNEAKQLPMVLESMPEFVDKIVVINDCSTDNTIEVVKSFINKVPKGLTIAPRSKDHLKGLYQKADAFIFEMFEEERKSLPNILISNETPDDDRIILINHRVNSGKGAAVATGYDWCRRYGIDCTVTIDGDGQMDPSEMIKICEPIVSGTVDFVKGNRLSHRAAAILIPSIRFFGNSVLSVMTKVASGYWGVTDTQTGYTAINLKALDLLRLDRIYRRYGVPNDILIKLNINRSTIAEVDIRPVYGVGEQSKMKVMKVIPRISWLLFKAFFKRIWINYFIKSLHPIFLLYSFSCLMFVITFIFTASAAFSLFVEQVRPPLGDYFAIVACCILAFQSLTVAMWMDIEDNKRLIKQ